MQEKFLLFPKSRLKKLHFYRKCPLKKLLFPAILQANHKGEPLCCAEKSRKRFMRRTAEQAGDADESKIINYQGLQLNLDKKTVSIVWLRLTVRSLTLDSNLIYNIVKRKWQIAIYI